MRLPATLALACATVVTSSGQKQQKPQAAQKTEIEKAVEEFKAITRELGLRPDSPARKGPNGGLRARWHGRVFENFRNDALDAIPHEVAQLGGSKSTLRRNQFGFNLAGPLLIPKLYDGRRATHFSISYEGVREKIARSQLRTIPTMPERAGDWSAIVDQAGNPLPIYDPRTTRRNPAFDPSQPVSTENIEYARAPFPDNRIPSNHLDPVARRALEYYPAPNAAVGPFFRNNYFIHTPEVNEANGVIAKLDHSLRERHRASLGITVSNGLLASARWFPSAANPGPADRRFQTRRGSLEHVFTASPRTVNTFTFDAGMDSSRSGAGDATSYPAAIGLGNSPGAGFPVFSLGGYLGMGQSNPASRNVRDWFAWTNAFSTRRGPHGFRVVAQYERNRVNTYWPQYPSGSLRFSSGLTSLPGIVNTGHGFASFLLGLAEYGEVSIVGSPSYFRTAASVIALRHSYEATRGLTFNLGVNLEVRTPRTEKYDRQSTVDLRAINPANGRKGALIAARPDSRAFQPLRAKWEPSAGISWNPRGDAKTVVRANYSRSYSGIPVYFGQWGTQGFNGTPTFISPNTQLEPAVTLAAGLPALTQPLPDLRPEAANDTVADLIDRSHLVPVYQSASLSLEREAPGAMVVTIGAAYSGGRNLLVSAGAADLNAIPLDALRFRDALNDEAFNRSLRPYPQYKGFNLYSSWPKGRYQRDAGYLRLEKRASAGLTLSAYYEFSKQMDDYSGPYGTQDMFNRANEWSLTAGSSPHRFSLSYVYELPFGSSRARLAFTDWRRHMIDGWSLSGATSFASGDPLALHPQFNNTGGVVRSVNVNVVPGVDPHVENPSPELWFNPAAFEHPDDFAIGNASRTHPSLRAPISQNHDLSLSKRFALPADRAVEFTAVGLNWLNHANWNDPDTIIGPESAPNVNAGRIIGSRGGRVIQMGLRFTF